MSHPYLRDELRVGLTGTGFKIPAKGIGHHPRDCGYLVQVDLPGEMPEGIIINSIDPLILHLGEIMPETDGRKGLYVRSHGKRRKAFYQRDDPAHALRPPDLLHKDWDLAMFPCIDLHASTGLIQ